MGLCDLLRFLAQERATGKPTGRYVAYREYLAGGRTIKQHAEAWLKDEPRRPTMIGGSKSESCRTTPSMFMQLRIL